MKLITEQNFELNYLKEGKDGDKQNYFIEGTFMQGEIKNRNGRLYPKSVLMKEMQRYNTEYVDKNRAYGELGHPDGPTINLDKVSHMIKELKEDGNNIIGKAKVLDTPMGRVVKSLMDEGCMLGVSSRGMGTLKPAPDGSHVVSDDFQLATAGDIVADPSAPEAFVRGVMESVDWIYDVASGNWRAMEIVDQVLQTGQNSARKLQEGKVLAFEHFINSLKRSGYINK